MRHFTLLLQFIAFFCAAAEITPAAVHNDAWRAQELRRARTLIRQHDFTPIDEAFAAKDIKLLWHYYICSYELNFQLYERITAETLKAAEQSLKNDPEQLAVMKRAFERSQYAGRYLRQIPGHARLLGDMIEETLYRRAGGGWMRRTYFECLWRLGQDGSDECIVEIGRYLFDQRNPGFRPYDPAKPKVSIYDTRGVPNTVQSDAIGSMLAVIRPRFKACESCVDAEGLLLKGFEEKVQNWWLTSEQAAPYRRSLAATGVVLPPGYPPMKELEGTKTTIAPPLKNPPYPDGESAPVETPPPGAVPQPTSPK
jgi:hypothetical protein